MKKKIISLLACLAMISTLLIGCGEKEVPAEEPTTETTDMSSEEEITSETEEVTEGAAGYAPGTWNGNIYTNSQLGFTMTFPDDYTIITGESLKKVDEPITEPIIYDFMALAGDSASNISFVVEENPMKLTSEEYNNISLKKMDVLGPKYEIVNEPFTLEVANLDFYQADIVVESRSGQAVSQSHLIHTDENYIYYFIFSMREERINEMFSIIDSISTIEENASAETEETSVETAKESTEYVPGTWDGNAYINSHLGFTMTIPDSYTILTGDSLEETIEDTTNSLKVNVDSSELITDFMAIAPDGATNISFGAEKNSMNLSCEKYKDMVLKTFDIVGVNYKFLIEPYFAKIGKVDFYCVNVLVDYSPVSGIENNSVFQTYFIYTDEDYIYTLVFTLGKEDCDEYFAIQDTIKAIE